MGWLLGLIPFVARLDRRSTPGRFVRFLQGEDLFKQYMNDLAEDTKKAVDPSELQRWAVTVLRDTPESESVTTGVPEEKIAVSIRNLRTNGMAFEMVGCNSEDSADPQERSVCIWWGGGFGHWGIRVGAPTFKVDPASEDNAYIEWRPGIYFWREK